MTLVDSRQFIPYSAPVSWPGEMTHVDKTLDEISAYVKANPLLAREVLLSYPGQRGAVRVDSIQDTYDYFSNRFNQLKS